jgi:predicted nucleotide-binding protein
VMDHTTAIIDGLLAAKDEVVGFARAVQEGIPLDRMRPMLGMWTERTERRLRENVSEREAERFDSVANSNVSYLSSDPEGEFVDECSKLANHLIGLVEDVSAHPEDYPVVAVRPVAQATVENGDQPIAKVGDAVFIVHGHDHANLERLKGLVANRWKLEPIVIKDLPGGSSHLMELLEKHGSRAGFAFVLFTPDDFVKNDGEEIYQARPNAILELGWFAGRLGRDRVATITKKGTAIPSDWQGIRRIEFTSSVEECFLALERELVSVGLIDG